MLPWTGSKVLYQTGCKQNGPKCHHARELVLWVHFNASQQQLLDLLMRLGQLLLECTDVHPKHVLMGVTLVTIMLATLFGTTPCIQSLGLCASIKLTISCASSRPSSALKSQCSCKRICC